MAHRAFLMGEFDSVQGDVLDRSVARRCSCGILASIGQVLVRAVRTLCSTTRCMRLPDVQSYGVHQGTLRSPDYWRRRFVEKV